MMTSGTGLATKGHRLGRRVLRHVATIVTPDTILRWHRRLIAEKWTYARKGPGRPGTMKKIAALIVRMATENPTWGYSRIQGAMKNLEHRVARSTVAKVLKDYTLFMLDLKSRRVVIAGSTRNPDAAFMAQAARRLTDAVDGC